MVSANAPTKCWCFPFLLKELRCISVHSVLSSSLTTSTCIPENRRSLKLHSFLYHLNYFPCCANIMSRTLWNDWRNQCHFVHISILLPAFCVGYLISGLYSIKSMRMNFDLKQMLLPCLRRGLWANIGKSLGSGLFHLRFIGDWLPNAIFLTIGCWWLHFLLKRNAV